MVFRRDIRVNNAFVNLYVIYAVIIASNKPILSAMLSAEPVSECTGLVCDTYARTLQKLLYQSCVLSPACFNAAGFRIEANMPNETINSNAE